MSRRLAVNHIDDLIALATGAQRDRVEMRYPDGNGAVVRGATCTPATPSLQPWRRFNLSPLVMFSICSNLGRDPGQSHAEHRFSPPSR